MKMREFIDAIDQTLDLTEAEDKIAEKNSELTEAPIPEDWMVREKWSELERKDQ